MEALETPEPLDFSEFEDPEKAERVFQMIQRKFEADFKVEIADLICSLPDLHDAREKVYQSRPSRNRLVSPEDTTGNIPNLLEVIGLNFSKYVGKCVLPLSISDQSEIIEYFTKLFSNLSEPIARRLRELEASLDLRDYDYVNPVEAAIAQIDEEVDLVDLLAEE